MSEIKKEYINADDKFVAYRKLYVNVEPYGESTSDPYVYTDPSLEETKRISKDELVDAFLKGCVIIYIDPEVEDYVPTSYIIPTILNVYDETYAGITIDGDELYSAEYEG